MATDDLRWQVRTSHGLFIKNWKKSNYRLTRAMLFLSGPGCSRASFLVDLRLLANSHFALYYLYIPFYSFCFLVFSFSLSLSPGSLWVTVCAFDSWSDPCEFLCCWEDCSMNSLCQNLWGNVESELNTVQPNLGKVLWVFLRNCFFKGLFFLFLL